MKIKSLKYTIEDVITTDGYLEFCNQNDICYIKTDFFYTGPLIWRGNKHPNNISNTCVIGHSDYPVVDEISNKFDKVFCINRASDSENTFGLPLGITNDCDDSPIHRIYGNKKIMIDVFNENHEKRNLAYLNFNISNYPSERQIVWNNFHNLDWVFTGQIDNTIDGRTKFLRDIKSSKFVFCPRGNGVDTHRLWESLYMGSIPIVKYDKAHHLVTDLPIIFIDSWDKIDQEFLENKYDEFIKKDWNFDKLKISYWTNLIKLHII